MLVLVLNCGSSSVKLHVVDTVTAESVARANADRIKAAPGGKGGYGEAIRRLLSELPPGLTPEAVGHRVVHGGETYTTPQRVDDDVLAGLERQSVLAPLHNPPNLAGIRIARELFPGLPHVAAFDTAFHATIPEHAYRYAIPERFYQEHGVRRYGFHGLSHRYVSEQAAAMLGRADLRLVTLHLGNGCSAAAVRAGQCEDTSMGFTPLEGLVMGTRSGDLDPAAPLFIQRVEGMDAAEVDRLLNRECGLKALSGESADMRDIEAGAAAGNPRARLAFDVFCHHVRKYVGAYAAVLGGLDAVVFTAGIGENSAGVRASVCRGLEFLGIRLDAALNGKKARGPRDVAAADAPARVLVIPTYEELVIARDTEATLRMA